MPHVLLPLQKTNRTLLSRILFTVFLLAGALTPLQAQPTFCNPLNLDYAYVFKRDAGAGGHRSTADPAIVRYKGDYYLFSTNQEGYWWSKDLLGWNFVRHDFDKNKSGDNVCAPATMVSGDTLFMMASAEKGDKNPLYISVDPKAGRWQKEIDSFPLPVWDPALFKDDNGRVFLYFGSSNVYPIYGIELSPARHYYPRFPLDGIIRLQPQTHGWERFGQDNTDSTVPPYAEGAWMNKHDGKYYLQYAAPGTEWNVYADGVYTAKYPLGPFTYAPYNPFSYKPGGFMTGAGHGCTFDDEYGNYWHAATGLAWIHNKFERRLGLYPAGFDAGGVLYANTAFGDYPQYLPKGKRDGMKSSFTGWMLLSYHKKVTASSSVAGHEPALAVDENIRTFWSAGTAATGAWFQVDLGAVKEVRAIQVNFSDDSVSATGKQGSDAYHQYKILQSQDGNSWRMLVDKSHNKTEAPHDYVALPAPVPARYLKIVNVHMPSGNFALGDLRVFGKGDGPKPAPAADFRVTRNVSDRRVCTIDWKPSPGAYAYNIYFGISKDKLYNCMMAYDTAQYIFRGMNTDQPYYFSIEAIGEAGVSVRSEVVEAK